jgi:hypothetical protein
VTKYLPIAERLRYLATMNETDYVKQYTLRALQWTLAAWAMLAAIMAIIVVQSAYGRANDSGAASGTDEHLLGRCL